MAEPYIGQIIMAGFNFAPRNYAFCDGRLIGIAQNSALFSLLGTTYGGDGQVTFALPNLQSRVSVHQGQGPGLQNYPIGMATGSETVTLLMSNLPAHNHIVNASTSTANAQENPGGNYPGVDTSGTGATFYNTSPDTTMNVQMVGASGGNQPHNNLQPYLTINFCIALYGVFPSRN